MGRKALAYFSPCGPELYSSKSRRNHSTAKEPPLATLMRIEPHDEPRAYPHAIGCHPASCNCHATCRVLRVAFPNSRANARRRRVIVTDPLSHYRNPSCLCVNTCRHVLNPVAFAVHVVHASALRKRARSCHRLQATACSLYAVSSGRICPSHEVMPWFTHFLLRAYVCI